MNLDKGLFRAGPTTDGIVSEGSHIRMGRETPACLSANKGIGELRAGITPHRLHFAEPRNSLSGFQQ
jgi:hypothetical protein